MEPVIKNTEKLGEQGEYEVFKSNIEIPKSNADESQETLMWDAIQFAQKDRKNFETYLLQNCKHLSRKQKKETFQNIMDLFFAYTNAVSNIIETSEIGSCLPDDLYVKWVDTWMAMGRECVQELFDNPKEALSRFLRDVKFSDLVKECLLNVDFICQYTK